jgi:hypothetical protein
MTSTVNAKVFEKLIQNGYPMSVSSNKTNDCRTSKTDNDAKAIDEFQNLWFAVLS